jgi:DNA replication protein DnaC
MSYDEQNLGVEYRVSYPWRSVCIVRDVDFARECADQFKDGHDGKKLKSWRTCAVLFIDDLGKCRITERVQTELFDLVDSRTSNGLPILFTSNFDRTGFIKRFASPDDAAPIVRRLVESCQIVSASGRPAL